MRCTGRSRAKRAKNFFKGISHVCAGGGGSKLVCGGDRSRFVGGVWGGGGPDAGVGGV